MLNKIGPQVHFADDFLILRLKTQVPAHLYSNFLKGLLLSQKLGFLAEDLTKDEKESLLALNEVAALLMPSSELLEEMMEAQLLTH